MKNFRMLCDLRELRKNHWSTSLFGWECVYRMWCFKSCVWMRNILWKWQRHFPAFKKPRINSLGYLMVPTYLPTPSYVSWISLERLTFSKIYLESDRFWRLWFRRTDKVSFKSSCFLDWNVMFAKVASIDKIKLIYMAVVFVFCWVP